MIPKIIHYTWFSGDPFPEKIKDCIDSWHMHMPEYEYILWDAERIKEIDSVWLKECLDKRKWAFAADFVRLYAVAQFGGIYLDTDCMIYKSFDSLLENQCFIGKENSLHILGKTTEQYLSSHCFGAEAGNLFIAKCLSYYKDRHFVLSENDELPMSLKYSTQLLPYIQSEIAKQWGYDPSPLNNSSIQTLRGLSIMPSAYFDITKLTDQSYCRHLALGGWRDSKCTTDAVTWQYKIRWRVEAAVSKLLGMFGYIMVKLS